MHSPLKMTFSGKVALVTGAGSPQGIGFATARLLAWQGAKLAITSTTQRIEDRARELSSERGGVLALVADLRDYRRTQVLVQDVLNRFGSIDILVNNAGMTQIGSPGQTSSLPMAELPEEDWDYGIALNLKTTFNVTKAYSAAKAAVVGLTRSLALEVARRRITVNAVAPGWIETASSTDHEIVAGKNTPVGRPGHPDEVAAAVAFLASESASYITGQLIIVDGGNSLQEYKGPPGTYY
jgi:3-oxoacyl-[acyl-carrier protein] reductase